MLAESWVENWLQPLQQRLLISRSVTVGMGAVWVISSPSTPAAPLLALTRLNARSSSPSSVPPAAAPALCRGQLASSLTGLRTASPCYVHPPRLRGYLALCLLHRHGLEHFSSFGPSHPTRSYYDPAEFSPWFNTVALLGTSRDIPR